MFYAPEPPQNAEDAIDIVQHDDDPMNTCDDGGLTELDTSDPSKENVQDNHLVQESKRRVDTTYYRWQIEHMIFPMLKRNFAAPKFIAEREVVQIANLPDLYRVFERC